MPGARGYAVVSQVLLCGFHKHLLLSQALHHILFFFFTHNYQATHFLLGNTRCHAYCLHTALHTLLALSRHACLSINLAMWITFTGKPGKISPPTILPDGYTCLSRQAFKCLTVIYWSLKINFPFHLYCIWICSSKIA